MLACFIEWDDPGEWTDEDTFLLNKVSSDIEPFWQKKRDCCKQFPCFATALFDSSLSCSTDCSATVPAGLLC